MKHEQTINTVCVELQTHELWYLVKLIAPGQIFGVDDPSEGLSEQEKLSLENQAHESLEKADMIKRSSAGQLIVDEMLGAMVFSCIKSKDILIVTDKNINQKWYYFFLPDWRVELKKENDVYKLTQFSDREILLSTLLEEMKLDSSQLGEKQEFFIEERHLEVAAFLYESGIKDKSLIELEENLIGALPEMNEFIQGYNKSEKHYMFDSIFAHGNEELTIQEHYEVLQFDKHLYWLTRWVNELNGEKLIYFQEKSSEELIKLLDYVLP